jgi:Flp pilus assembly protein TadG
VIAMQGTRTSIRRTVRSFLAEDERGTTAVEFAMISVPFLGLFLAIFQTGFLFFASESLESAVSDASRAIMTGEVQNASITTAADFRDQLICNPTAPRRRILPSFFDCSRLVIDVQQPTSFGSANMARNFYNSSTSFSPGGAGCVSVVRVAYPFPIFLPILTVNGQSTTGQVTYNSMPTYIVQTAAVFRNEPFSTSNTGC